MAFSEVVHSGTSITKASKALIILHGRGGSARNILKLAKNVCDESFYIAAPQAVNNAWYPYSFMEDEKLNEPFLSSSINAIKKLIYGIARDIPQERIYLMGFSQGACLSLEVSAKFAAKYGGIIAFTGGLIGQNLDESKYQGNFEGTKIFISNATHDPYIPLERSEQSKEIMQKLGGHVLLKVYKRDTHIIDEDEILSAKMFILSS